MFMSKNELARHHLNELDNKLDEVCCRFADRLKSADGYTKYRDARRDLVCFIVRGQWSESDDALASKLVEFAKKAMP